MAFGVVFPAGAYALGVEAITNFATKRPEVDKDSGLLLWAVDVIDADPNARGKAKSVKVKVAAEVCPTLPDEVPGLPFRPIEFEGMTVVPHADDNGRRPRVAYSLRARGVKAPGGAARRPAKDTARTVPLPDICVNALRAHRKRQFTEPSGAARDWDEQGLVFPSRRGTPLEPDSLRRSWAPLRKAAGLDEIRFHDLRHTCVTLLLNLEAPPQIVRELAGHSDIGVVMALYARLVGRQTAGVEETR